MQSRYGMTTQTLLNAKTTYKPLNITYRIRMNANNNVIAQLLSFLQKVDVTNV